MSVQVSIECEHCGDMFDVDRELVGGFTNCGRCGKATTVPGLRDGIWRLSQFYALLIIGFLTYVTNDMYGPLAAATVFLIGVIVAWVISRFF